MKLKLLLLILTLFIIGCTTRRKDFDSIEMMAYNWSIYNDTTREMAPVFFKCRMYVKIDESGVGNVYKYSGYPKPSTSLFSLAIEKKLIDRILNSAIIIDTSELIKERRKPRIYDGPTIKLRIKYFKNESRLFDFIEDHDINEIHNFLQLYYYLDSVYVSKKYNPISDIIVFEKNRLDFINFIMNYDTTTYPKVPPPSPVDSIRVIYQTPTK